MVNNQSVRQLTAYCFVPVIPTIVVAITQIAIPDTAVSRSHAVEVLTFCEPSGTAAAASR